MKKTEGKYETLMQKIKMLKELEIYDKAIFHVSIMSPKIIRERLSEGLDVYVTRYKYDSYRVTFGTPWTHEFYDDFIEFLHVPNNGRNKTWLLKELRKAKKEKKNLVA